MASGNPLAISFSFFHVGKLQPHARVRENGFHSDTSQVILDMSRGARLNEVLQLAAVE